MECTFYLYAEVEKTQRMCDKQSTGIVVRSLNFGVYEKIQSGTLDSASYPLLYHVHGLVPRRPLNFFAQM